jgi:predicted SnoaL-like aldol condensation-catalyzing enzyme
MKWMNEMKRNKIIILSAVLLSLSACGSGSKNKTATVESPPVVTNTPIAEPCNNVGCEANQTSVIKQIYNDIINEGNSALADSIYTESFIQHNTAIGSGVAEQIAYFDALKTNNPEHTAVIKHIASDGEYVAVHWHYSATSDNEKSGEARIDLYKLLDNMVVEQWNVSMTLNAVTASGNSVFSDLYIYSNNNKNNNTELEESNKTLVSDFYTKTFNEYDLDLFDATVDENYLQHNPYVPSGSAPLRGWIESQGTPQVDIFISLAEEDIVWTFQTKDNNLSVVDLWRVDNNINKIVEHWDVFK